MHTLYYIKVDDTWKQVSFDEYSTFDGEKERRPSTWALQIVNSMLIPYRYM